MESVLSENGTVRLDGFGVFPVYRGYHDCT